MKPKDEDNSRWTQKDERILQRQTCILIAMACFFCAAAILFQLFCRGEVLYDKTSAEITVSTIATPIPENSTISDSGSPQSTAQEKININTAEKEELMTLTGVGEAKAQSIIAYREEHGGFQSIEELMQIEGIKEGVFNKIKEDITI